MEVSSTPWANNRVRLAVTSACNLSCYYCHNEGQAKGQSYMSTGLLRHVADMLENSPALSSITYTGGEALLHPNLESIVRATSRYARSATLVTNGHLLNESALSRLTDAGIRKIRLGIDSVVRQRTRPSPGSPDPDGFVRELIDRVRRADIACELNIVLSQYNAREIPMLIEFCRVHSMSAKFFEVVKVTALGGINSSSIMTAMPVLSWEWFKQTALEVDASLLHYTDWTMNAGNEVLESSEYSLRYCRFLCDYQMCYVTGTRVDADGGIYACMRSGPRAKLEPSQTIEVSMAKVQSISEYGCDRQHPKQLPLLHQYT